MKRKAKKRRIWLGALIVLAALVLWTIWGNITVQTTVYHVHDSQLPEGFEGYRIAQISDLHNAEFGADNQKLLSILKKEQPDIIAMTGDLVDSNHTDIEIATTFARQAVEIAPCYYVTGNHEAWLGETYETLEKQLEACGVMVLRNQSVTLHKGSDTVQLMGIDDPDFAESGSGMFDLEMGIISEEIKRAEGGDGYRILLSHRPEVFSTYVDSDISLALCGHAHGGQFRLPFIGGLVAPNQGLFPQYDGGVYTQDGTTMIVSRGIGNSIIPVRFNNRPEVVIAVLHNL